MWCPRPISLGLSRIQEGIKVGDGVDRKKHKQNCGFASVRCGFVWRAFLRPMQAEDSVILGLVIYIPLGALVK